MDSINLTENLAAFMVGLYILGFWIIEYIVIRMNIKIDELTRRILEDHKISIENLDKLIKSCQRYIHIMYVEVAYGILALPVSLITWDIGWFLAIFIAAVGILRIIHYIIIDPIIERIIFTAEKLKFLLLLNGRKDFEVKD